MRAYFRSIAGSLDLGNQTYNTLLFVVSIGFSVLMLKLVTSYLPPAEYGMYQYVLAMVGVASITVMPGGGTILGAYVAKGKHGVPRQLTNFSLKSGVLGLLFLASATVYEYAVAANGRAAALMGCATLVFLPYSVYARYEAVLTGLQQFRELLLVRTLLMGLQFLAAAIVLVMLRQDYVSFGTTMLTIQTVMYWQFYLLAAGRLRNDEISEGAVRHAVVVSGVDAGVTLLEPALQLYVNSALGPSALGVFVVAKRIITQAGGIVKPLMKPLSIKLTREGRTTHRRALIRLVPLALLLGVLQYVCLLIGIALLGPMILGPSYHVSLEYAKTFGFILFITPLYVLLGNYMVFEGRNRAWAGS